VMMEGLELLATPRPVLVSEDSEELVLLLSEVVAVLAAAPLVAMPELL
jgi:hypothetical protein